ncbi:MAG: hypothetical protein ABIR18_01040 [Chitinophagaceae bacterium]
MSSNNLSKAALLMVVLVVAAIASWELYLRSKGVAINYDDGAPLWADKRAMVYEPADRSTVFIGSSRIKFDLDFDTWKEVTGDQAVMLAIQGSSPVPLLHDLADDKNFKGKLVIDVTEPLFFGHAPPMFVQPKEYIDYYNNRTPAQRASFAINHFLESRLVFLDEEYLSLNAQLGALNVKSRPGVYIFPPPPGFPMDFDRNTFDRRSRMTDKFVADTNQHKQVTAVWAFLMPPPPKPGDPRPSQESVDSSINGVIQAVKISTDKIKARGGQIIFVRTPSSGQMGMGEKMGFPRERYWNKLLEVTGTAGIHFADYPSIDHFICPEWSHLAPGDANIFTRELAKILTEKGWKFPKLSGTK